jgi:hypothetical protein
MRAAGEGLQIECDRELTVHDRLALRADEPELITRAPSRCRAVGSSAAAGHADSKRPASPAAGDAQAGLQKIAAPDHRVASPVTSLRPQLAPSCSPRLGSASFEIIRACLPHKCEAVHSSQKNLPVSDPAFGCVFGDQAKDAAE